MKIEILGTGCVKCNKLEDMVKLAIRETGIEAEIGHVHDIKKIMEYGVMTTPALVIDGEVKAAGKIPPLEEIKKLLGSK
ncbi:MAG: glutaredoxin [Deltaproteobacteria bacterium RBG_19FT_COMBO_43_11]|nr:MAG: glutaredoxin [Deltaproteobacteria bacterium RBG_16_44_11]OGP90745.1 MAG: glutaredoxin [Deltaproteobacteria bacterium RBG_19FT_COMBO_43_11]